MTEATKELPTLWACHKCGLLGPAITAVGHEATTGHQSQRVTDEHAIEVRKIWCSEGRSLIDGAAVRENDKQGER